MTIPPITLTMRVSTGSSGICIPSRRSIISMNIARGMRPTRIHQGGIGHFSLDV